MFPILPECRFSPLDSSHATAHASMPLSINRRKVANHTPNTPDARERVRHRILLQAVLRYLNENGPINWVTLYVHFDDGTRDIGAALGYLALCKHIAIEGTTTKITARGTEQLQTKG